MDRELTPEQHRARRASFVAKGVLLVALLGALGGTGRHFLSPSVDRKDLLIEVVERGPLEATVTASGTVVPRRQETVSSPVGAAVRTVLVSLGERVQRGTVIMQLDTTASRLELHNLEERLALSRAALRSDQLQLEDSVRQARSQRELRAIDLESRQARVARLEQLEGEGIVSKAELLEAHLDVKRTQVEIVQLDDGLLSLRKRQRAQLERLERESAILETQRADQARRIEMSAVKAPIDGVVTGISPRTGAVIAEGAPLATVAAQDAFSVEAALSDFYAPQLKPGQRVRVRASTSQFDGHVSRILPTEDASRLMLFIELDDPTAPRLYANLRVEADIVVAEKTDALHVRRGPAIEGGGGGQVYVVDGDRAVRKPVRFGLNGSQQVEIVGGLAVGDRVIVSDMQSWKGLSQIRIR
jgi:HlyD family secretion protein